MTETDFDELDRAVNSIMTDVPGANQASVVLPTATQSASIVDSGAVVPGANPVAPSMIASSGPPAARRGGRFMDVVHRSSDMKAPSAPQGVPSHVGVTVAPPLSPEPVVVESPPVIETVEAPQEAFGAVKPVDLTDIPSLSSPFLMDAKVEKRPLGGGLNMNEVLAAELAKDGLMQEEVTIPKAVDSLSDAQLVPEVEIALPEELDSNLVAIESGKQSEMVMPIEPDSDKDDVSLDKVVVPSVTEPPLPVVALTTDSIPQQYTEQPNSGDSSHAPIYDSEEAHNALAHPAKKKSGWLWVMWILLIVLLGAGAGAAVYFFGLI